MNNEKLMIEKLELSSMDVSKENRTKLKTLFPSAFCETQNEKGEIVESIDFEKLKSEMGSFSDLFEGRRERYGMEWPGKNDCLKLIQKSSIATLKPCREESVNFDNTENLFIEGDNLEVLKLLQKSYYGKIKMIYIDPPYNTGKEFIYSDNYKDSLKNYLDYTGQVDIKGRKSSTNTTNEGRFHTKWLNMMYPRLYLAHNLLKEDGVIFISIDDNEVCNCKNLLNNVFGEENFLAQIVWKKKYIGGRHAKHFIDFHEYILVYGKHNEAVDAFLMDRPESELEKFELKDDYYEKRGGHYIRPLKSNLGERKTLVYPIVCPDNKILETQWMVSESTFHLLVKDGRILFKKKRDGSYQVYRKYYENDGLGKVKVPSIIDDVANANGKIEIKELFNIKEGRDIPFDNPKPIGLLKHIIAPTLKEGDIILDYFAGSCSTAHAIFDLNKKDGIKRRYIMIQLPETCKKNSSASKLGYKTISEIGMERIRRVIKKIEVERSTKIKTAKNMIPGMSDKMPDIDLGFKVLKLDKSNFRVWEGPVANALEDDIKKAIQEHLFNIDEKSSQEDILYEILLKAGFMSTEKIEKLQLEEKTVYSIAEGSLLICLENEITSELIDKVAEIEPLQFICLDRGFKGNDQLKANAVQTFTVRNQGRDQEKQIVFRTV